MKFDAKYIVRAAIIAAIYVALCLLLQPISYGVLQVRVAEAMTILPVIFPEAMLGLGIGVIIANIAGLFGIVDIVFGSIATILAAFLTYKTRKTKYFFIWPIALNALIVGTYLPMILDMNWSIPFSIFAVGSGEAIAVIVLGLPLLAFLKNRTNIK